jgi:hypothetical protein
MPMLQFPFPVPPGTPEHIPSQTEQFVSFVVLSAFAVTFIFLTLPRPIFCKLFKIAFPFVPKRLEDFDEKD